MVTKNPSDTKVEKNLENDALEKPAKTNLAEEDYQLYEALNILKSMNLIQKMNLKKGITPLTKVLIPLAQGCEELEAVTIIDLLRRAEIEVVTASLNKEPVKCSRGTVLIADTSLDEILEDSFDMLVLPGGLPGADNLNADPRIHQIITRLENEDKHIAAICAAPKVLLENGILNGKKATAYPGSLNAMDTSKIKLNEDAIQIDDKVITSRGPGTAMDFALTLIETLMGKEIRIQVETGLQRA